MILSSLKKAHKPMPNVLEDASVQKQIRIDDEFTVNLQTQELPLEIQLMLVPLWTLRSDYQDCMKPLDRAMENYMNFRAKLLETDKNLVDASTEELGTAFDHIFTIMKFYERNQSDLLRLLQKGNHQLSFYSRATKNDLMWDEMLKLKEIDYVAFSRRTCCFEHVVMSLFSLVDSIRGSVKTSQDITRCCACYLGRILKYCNEEHRKISPKAPLGLKDDLTKSEEILKSSEREVEKQTLRQRTSCNKEQTVCQMTQTSQ